MAILAKAKFAAYWGPNAHAETALGHVIEILFPGCGQVFGVVALQAHLRSSKKPKSAKNAK